MTILNKETKNIQNPALGALLLWRFTASYESHSQTHEPTPLPLLFIILPILFHEETVGFIETTRVSSGLRAFADKFSLSSNAKNDFLLTIQKRAIQMRGLTKDSLLHAFAARLLTLLPDKGKVIALSATEPRAGVPVAIRDLCKHATKLGAWCAKLSLHEISVTLRIGF